MDADGLKDLVRAGDSTRNASGLRVRSASLLPPLRKLCRLLSELSACAHASLALLGIDWCLQVVVFGGVFWYRNRGTTGSPSGTRFNQAPFRVSKFLQTGNKSPQAMRVGDVDGDGDADVLVLMAVGVGPH